MPPPDHPNFENHITMNVASKTEKSDAVNQLDESEPRWFAIYTNFKREKLVAGLLANKGIEAYVPLQHLTRRYTRKIRQVALPLINCYVFVKIIKPQYVPVLQTQDVLRFIKFSQDLLAIPDTEMDILRRIAGDANVGVTVVEGVFSKGDMVEVASGNLAGVKGRLIEERGEKAFVVELQHIGLGLRVEIPVTQLVRVTEREVRTSNRREC